MTIRLRPDPQIFPVIGVDPTPLEGRLAHLAALCPGLTTRLVDERTGRVVERCLQSGLVDHVRELWTTGVLDPPAGGSATAGEGRGSIRVDVGLTSWARTRRRGAPAWRPFGAHDATRSPVLAYVNFVQVAPTGAIEAGLRAGLEAAAPPDTTPEAIERARRRVVGAIHVRLAEPRFEGSTRAVLAAPEVGPVIRDAVVAALAAADPAQVAALWTRARRRMG